MIETFANEKEKILQKLDFLKNNLKKLEDEFDLDLTELIQKVKKGISNLQNEYFSIAFFGAFSDGKTTILSAITHRLDLKIAPEPTTDKIIPCKFGDYIFIDTPGLFSEVLMHDELTRKYISEANVIIYTLDPVNPLKESHHPVVKWLLSDLLKIDATIFVVNKMDFITDLDDEGDFIKGSEIKKKVVIDTLADIVSLKKEPKVLCIAGDPAGKGLPFWFERMEDYKRLSRIDELFREIESFVKQYRDKLIMKAGLSVIRDSVDKTIEKLEGIRDDIEKEIKITTNHAEEISSESKILTHDINKGYTNIKEEIHNLRKEIILSLDSAKDIESLRNTVNREIGEDGYIINDKIYTIIQKYTVSLYENEEKFLKDMENSLEYHERMNEKLLKSLSDAGAKYGAKILDKSKSQLMKKLFEVRRTLKLDKLIKFKTGGEAAKWAAKWAGRLQKLGRFLKYLPILIGVLELIMKIYSEHKFKEELNNIKKEIEELFKGFINDFSIEEYVKTYFPEKKEYEKTYNDLEATIKNYHEIHYKIKESISKLRELSYA